LHRNCIAFGLMSPLPPASPAVPTAPSAPNVGGPSAPNGTAAAFKAFMAGSQAAASTPVPTTMTTGRAVVPIAKPLFAMAMEILWKRAEKLPRSSFTGGRAAMFDSAPGASAMDGRKANLGVYLSLLAEVAAFFREKGKNGDRKKKRKQGSRRRMGDGRTSR
jgi:hypothetical protein